MNERKIPPGTYDAQGVEGSDRLGRSTKGTEQVAIDLTLESGERVFTILSFSEATEPYSRERLQALGWTGESRFDGTDYKFVGIGSKPVKVEIKYEIYENKEQMKVDILTGGRFAFKEPMVPSEQKAFMARLAHGTPKPPSTAAKPAQGQARRPVAPSRLPVDPQHGDAYEGPDDDIAF